MTFAVIPAAGKSVRMGRPKLALPLGDRTVLERVVASLRAAGVEHILVVVGPHVPELLPLAKRAGTHVVQLTEETPDMRATVEAGLRWLEERFRPRAKDHWLLVPADHPTLDPSLVRLLLSARARSPDKSIIVPAHGGRRGHPTLIDWKHVAGMRALPPGEGLNVYLRQHARETLELPVNSVSVLCDLDTPEDYDRLRGSFPTEVPSPETIHLFVYGTLMRGGVRHDILRKQRFIREALTRPNYLLLDLGPYPGLVVAEADGQAIHGELYEVECRLIPRLDTIEGAPELYRLEGVEVEGEAAVSAYVYQGRTPGLPIIEANRWHNS